MRREFLASVTMVVDALTSLRSLSEKRRNTPKSERMTRLSAETNTLFSLMSRWTIPWAWM